MADLEDSTIESVNAGGSGVSSRLDRASDRVMARRGGKVPPNGAVRGRYGRQMRVEPVPTTDEHLNSQPHNLWLSASHDRHGWTQTAGCRRFNSQIFWAGHDRPAEVED